MFNLIVIALVLSCSFMDHAMVNIIIILGLIISTINLLINFDFSIISIFELLLIINYLTISIYSFDIKNKYQKISIFLYEYSIIYAIHYSNVLPIFISFNQIALILSLMVIFFSAKNIDANISIAKYFFIQSFAGLCLIAGIAFIDNTSSSVINNTYAQFFLLISFGINAGFPLFNTWMHDLCTKINPVSNLILLTSMSKLGIFGLYITLPGCSYLIYIGIFVTIIQLILCLFENNLIKTYTHALNGYLGLIMIGIGIGNEIVLQGTIALIITQTICEVLIFMVIINIISQSKLEQFSDFKEKNINSPLLQILVFITIFVSGIPYFAGFIGKAIFLNSIQEYNFNLYFLVKFFNIGLFISMIIKLISLINFNSDKFDISIKMPINSVFAIFLQFILCLIIGHEKNILLYNSINYNIYDLKLMLEQIITIIFVILVFVPLFKTNYYIQMSGIINKISNRFIRLENNIFSYFSHNFTAIKSEKCFFYLSNKKTIIKYYLFQNPLIYFILFMIISLIMYLI